MISTSAGELHLARRQQHSPRMREFRPPQRRSGIRSLLAGVVGLVMLVPAVLFALFAASGFRVSYTVDAGTLTVTTGDFMTGHRRVPLADIASVQDVVLEGGLRTMGTALPGYCVGRFRYSNVGAVWQATDCSRRALLLQARGQDLPLLVTPPDPEAFRSMLARASGRIDLPPAAKGPVVQVLGLVFLLVLVSASMAIATMLLGPGRMRYRVGDGVFEVHTLFTRRSWPIAGLRARRHEPRSRWRIAGSAMPGYYTGFFRIDGESTRVYATDLGDGVLLEGAARVFLTPEHPDAFLTSFRAAGGTVEGARRG